MADCHRTSAYRGRTVSPLDRSADRPGIFVVRDVYDQSCARSGESGGRTGEGRARQAQALAGSRFRVLTMKSFLIFAVSATAIFAQAPAAPKAPAKTGTATKTGAPAAKSGTAATRPNPLLNPAALRARAP